MASEGHREDPHYKMSLAFRNSLQGRKPFLIQPIECCRSPYKKARLETQNKISQMLEAGAQGSRGFPILTEMGPQALTNRYLDHHPHPKMARGP